MKITEIAATENDKAVVRISAYCRVSSDSSDQLHSFAAQIKYYTDYIKSNPNQELVDIYADEGITGTCMKKRAEFNRMIRDCQKGKIDRIITKSVARFARNTEDLLTVLRLLKNLNVSIYFEEQGIDSNKMNMELIVTFPGMVAQQESESISGNMRWSYKKRMESGEFNCCIPAYGYEMVNGKLQVLDSEAVIVRQIFDLYLQGIGKQAIANILNAQNVSRRAWQKKWYINAITYILNNERYVGDALLQKTYITPLPYRKMKNHGELPQYYVENSNPPIISREIFSAVQSMIKSKAALSVSRNKYPLSRMLVCPDCGHIFRRQLINNSVLWACSYKVTARSNCHSIRLYEKDIYKTFNLMLRKLVANRKNLIGNLIRQFEVMQNKSGANRQQIYQIDTEIADLTAKHLMIARLNTKEILNAAEYASQSSDISQKVNKLRSDRNKKLSQDEYDELLDTLRRLNEVLIDYEIKRDFDSEIFENIVESIRVVSSSELCFVLKGGILLMEKVLHKE